MNQTPIAPAELQALVPPHAQVDAPPPAIPLANDVQFDASTDDDNNLVPYLLEMLQVEEQRSEFLTQVVIPLGAALAYETDFNHLLERILISAMSLSRADGGALYLRGEDKRLRLALLRRDSLGVAVGGTSPQTSNGASVAGAISIDDLNANGQPTSAADRAATSGKLIVESSSGSGVMLPEALDEGMGYRVESALAIPLRSNAGQVIGVIELCNARRPGAERPVPFEAAVQRVIEALSLLAAVALESYLREKRLKEQVAQLRVEVDNAKKHRQVEAIAESDYFRALQKRARELRGSARPSQSDPTSER